MKNERPNLLNFKNDIKQGKTAAITAYIMGIGVLIAMSINAEKRSEFASFHIRQSLGVTLTFISLGLIINNFDNIILSFTLWIFIFLMWSYGLCSAINGTLKLVPFLGKFFQKFLKGIS